MRLREFCREMIFIKQKLISRKGVMIFAIGSHIMGRDNLLGEA